MSGPSSSSGTALQGPDPTGLRQFDMGRGGRAEVVGIDHPSSSDPGIFEDLNPMMNKCSWAMALPQVGADNSSYRHSYPS